MLSVEMGLRRSLFEKWQKIVQAFFFLALLVRNSVGYSRTLTNTISMLLLFFGVSTVTL